MKVVEVSGKGLAADVFAFCVQEFEFGLKISVRSNADAQSAFPGVGFKLLHDGGLDVIAAWEL
jgi:hypothetical protein